MNPSPGTGLARAASDDRCPGALRLHGADDGHVARVRLPGGRLSAAQLLALCSLAETHGDGVLHLTSRGNLQVRGLSADAGTAVATALSEAGLLPSLAHDRVRNVVASPYADLSAELAAFDAALCAEPRLTALSGRFLFGIDDGSGDVAALAPDVLAVAGSASPAALAARMVAEALRFLELREAFAPNAWRVRELPEAAGWDARTSDLGATPTAPRVRTRVPSATTLWPPLGAAPTSEWRTLAAATDRLVVTPWRSVVVPDAPTGDLPPWGTDPAGTLARTSACIGRPGCGKALADVRRDALALAEQRPGERVHVSGCERRCGHPSEPFVDVVALHDGGYRTTRNEKP